MPRDERAYLSDIVEAIAALSRVVPRVVGRRVVKVPRSS